MENAFVLFVSGDLKGKEGHGKLCGSNGDVKFMGPSLHKSTGVHGHKTLDWLANQNILPIYPQWLTHDHYISKINLVKQDCIVGTGG